MMEDNQEIRIVLLGKTGGGKSSLGNSLLQKKVFKSSPLTMSSSSGRECQVGRADRPDGRRLVVVDTPGIGDVQTSTTDTFNQLTTCLHLSHPGPHVFLFVRTVERFTEEEEKVFQYLRYWFGEVIMEYGMFVFTGKDSLDYEGLTLDQHIHQGPGQLRSLISECKGRVAAINNRATGYELQGQVDDILNLVQQTVAKNGGGFYTQEMYRQVERTRARKPKWADDEQFRDEKDLRVREARMRMQYNSIENYSRKKTGCCTLL